MNKIRKILAPTDLSELSCTGMRYAVETGEKLGAEVIAFLSVPVDEDWYPTKDGTHSDRDYTAKEKLQLDKFLHEHFAEALKTGRLIPKVDVGAAASAILDYADREDIDLIVMSTHGRTGLKHILIGSVTEKVVERAPCPVLVVPRPRVV